MQIGIKLCLRLTLFMFLKGYEMHAFNIFMEGDVLPSTEDFVCSVIPYLWQCMEDALLKISLQAVDLSITC